MDIKRSLRIEASEDDLDAILFECDVNRDGYINRAETVACLIVWAKLAEGKVADAAKARRNRDQELLRQRCCRSPLPKVLGYVDVEVGCRLNVPASVSLRHALGYVHGRQLSLIILARSAG